MLGRWAARAEALRGAFWVPSAAAVVLAVLGGFAITAIERHVQIDLNLFGISDRASARAVLETIATATVSVAGLSFSVTLVALTLAAEQLSPRVLRTFRSDRVAQATLASFLGTFAYALIVLARLGEVDEARVPVLAITIAIALALTSFGLFVAFIGDIVVALQASTVIERIRQDATRAIAGRTPRHLGQEPDDAAQARRVVDHRIDAEPARALRAADAGYLTHLDPQIISIAADHDALVVQRAAVGDYVVTGQRLADVWPADLDDSTCDELRSAFKVAPERTVAADVRFPVRQLADIALRALSPGVNDPTTAENAMSALTDVLVQLARDEHVEVLRTDNDGRPRLLAIASTLDDLVVLGFEQVRLAASEDPLIARHLRHLLTEIRHTEPGSRSDAINRYLLS